MIGTLKLESPPTLSCPIAMLAILIFITTLILIYRARSQLAWLLLSGNLGIIAIWSGRVKKVYSMRRMRDFGRSPVT